MTHDYPTLRHRRPTGHRRDAFTLIEIMISVALALLLLLGISQVFRVSSDTIGTGYALSDTVRQRRGLNTILRHDFEGDNRTANTGMMIPTNAPFIAIRSERFFQYLNKADDDSLATPWMIDLNGDGTPDDMRSNATLQATFNKRNHRVDTISFFSHGNFKRQTGQNFVGRDTYMVDMPPVNDAFVWYGHTRIPNNATTGLDPNDSTEGGNFFSPAFGTAATNPNNYYPVDWVLGRFAVLLQAYTLGGLGDMTGGGYSPYICVFKPTPTADPSDPNPPSPPDPAPTAGTIPPLGYGSVLGWRARTAVGPPPVYVSQAAPALSAPYTAAAPRIEHSFCDLAAASAVQVRASIAGPPSLQTPLDGSGTPDTFWWRTFVYNYLNYNTAPAGGVIPFRFNYNPFPAQPINNQSVAPTVPHVITGCTQFIVEFAGDYCTQENDPNKTGLPPGTGNYGDILTGTPDGVPDFVVDPVTKKAQLKWYGMRRDTDPASSPGIDLWDVEPVASFLNQPAIGGKPAVVSADALNRRFERKDTISGTGDSAEYVAVWGPEELVPPATNAAVQSYPAFPAGSHYTYAPYAIRIAVTIVDKNGRLGDGVTQEYVFTCKR